MKKISEKSSSTIYIAMVVLSVTAMIILAIYNKKHREEKVKISNVYFGIDISHHQGTSIIWDSIANKHPVKFVICRATRGVYYRDSTFLKNFAEAKSRGYKVGAYHYFTPRQSVDSQAMNYLSMSMILIKGDFRPIVDIEEGDSTNKKKDPLLTDSLKKRFKFLLDTITQKHGVVPVIYTSLNFYKNNFKKDTAFNKYPLWLAAYGNYFDDIDIKQAFVHQFTDKVSISGIKKKVDGNNIPKKLFDSLLLKK